MRRWVVPLAADPSPLFRTLSPTLALFSTDLHSQAPWRWPHTLQIFKSINGPHRQGLCSGDFWPASSPSGQPDWAGEVVARSPRRGPWVEESSLWWSTRIIPRAAGLSCCVTEP